MATDTMTEVATFRYPGPGNDNDGDLVGADSWSTVLAAANRLAAEAGDEAPFRLLERVPWGVDPGDSAELYPEAWVIVHLARDPAEGRVEVVATSQRVGELLRLAHAEVTGTRFDAAFEDDGDGCAESPAAWAGPSPLMADTELVEYVPRRSVFSRRCASNS